MESAQIRCDDFNGLLLVQEGINSYVENFEVISVLGSLEVTSSCIEERDAWTTAIFAGICDCVEETDRTIGWRHHIRLGTIHAAVVTRDTLLIENFKRNCEEGILEYSVFDLPEYVPPRKILKFSCTKINSTFIPLE